MIWFDYRRFPLNRYNQHKYHLNLETPFDKLNLDLSLKTIMSQDFLRFFPLAFEVRIWQYNLQPTKRLEQRRRIAKARKL